MARSKLDIILFPVFTQYCITHYSPRKLSASVATCSCHHGLLKNNLTLTRHLTGWTAFCSLLCGRQQGSVKPTTGSRMTVSREGVGVNTFGVIENTVSWRYVRTKGQSPTDTLDYLLEIRKAGKLRLLNGTNDIPTVGMFYSQAGKILFPSWE